VLDILSLVNGCVSSIGKKENMNTPDEAMKSYHDRREREALVDMALDRLKSAGSPFELEKAQAIAAHVQWRIERADRGL